MILTGLNRRGVQFMQSYAHFTDFRSSLSGNDPAAPGLAGFSKCSKMRQMRQKMVKNRPKTVQNTLKTPFFMTFEEKKIRKIFELFSKNSPCWPFLAVLVPPHTRIGATYENAFLA